MHTSRVSFSPAVHVTGGISAAGREKGGSTCRPVARREYALRRSFRPVSYAVRSVPVDRAQISSTDDASPSCDRPEARGAVSSWSAALGYHRLHTDAQLNRCRGPSAAGHPPSELAVGRWPGKGIVQTLFGNLCIAHGIREALTASSPWESNSCTMPFYPHKCLVRKVRRTISH